MRSKAVAGPGYQILIDLFRNTVLLAIVKVDVISAFVSLAEDRRGYTTSLQTLQLKGTHFYSNTSTV